MTSLLAIALKGLVVMLAAALATRLLRTAPASTRHGIWVVAFAALLLLPVLEAAGPRWAVGVLPSAPASVSTRAVPALTAPPAPPAPPAPIAFAPDGADLRAFEMSMREFKSDMASFERQMQAFEGDRVAFESSMNVIPEAEGGFAVVSRSLPSSLPRQMGGWLLAVWGLGAVVVLLRWTAATLAARHLVASSRLETDDEWGVSAEHARRVSGLEHPVRLVRTDALDVPVAWGWGQPTVVLPADADDWDDDRREAVLLHEMAHLARRDAWTQAVAQIALAVHWMNPLAWWGYRQFLDAREQACDDAVIRSGARPSAYAAHLVGVARSIRRERLALSALAPMARTAPLEGRVVSILDASQARDSIGRPALVCLVALASAVVVPLAALQPVAQARPAPIPTPDWTAIADTLDTLYGQSDLVVRLGDVVVEADVAADLDVVAEGADSRPEVEEAREEEPETVEASDCCPVPEPPTVSVAPVSVDVSAIVESAVEDALTDVGVDIDEVRNQIQISIQDLDGDARFEATVEREVLRRAQRGLADLDPKALRIRARAALQARDSLRRSDRRAEAVDWTEIDRARRHALLHTRSAS